MRGNLGQVVAEVQGTSSLLVHNRKAHVSSEFDYSSHIVVGCRIMTFATDDENSSPNAQRTPQTEQIAQESVGECDTLSFNNKQRGTVECLGGLSEDERRVDYESLLCAHHSR
jgi:hypothetical protein